MFSGLLGQLQILWQLYSIELPECLIYQGLLVVVFDIFKAFNRVWYVGLLHKLKCYGVSGQVFGLISSFLSSERLRVVLDRNSSQEYVVNAGVLRGSILSPAFFLLYSKDMMLSVILLFILMILLTILNVMGHLICGNN